MEHDATYEDFIKHQSIDSDGFIRLIPRIDGRYYQYLEDKYTTYGYLAAGADSITTLVVHV